jgi:hypothetical protein
MFDINRYATVIVGFSTEYNYVAWAKYCLEVRSAGRKLAHGIGQWLGTREDAVIIRVNSNHELGLELSRAWKYGQDCVLVVDEHNQAVLFFSNGTEQFVGRLRAGKRPPRSGDYTKVNDNYFYTDGIGAQAA